MMRSSEARWCKGCLLVQPAVWLLLKTKEYS
ncbi:hypothetical protein MNBD_GAMMA20-270 [hydrothermal vent metagenome]|uniref:Uncharacterized protein n=1 Tax=hydrothermal vent metagenome TaxID=652676 RepID=A0A3B1AKT1_9ZZZZ